MARMGMWPTPLPSDVLGGRTTKGSKRPNESGLRKAAWPTPQNRDKNTYAKCKRGENSPGGTPLPVAVGGTLNPNWVEWLMGWPIGYTDLQPLATDKFQQWLHSHGITSEDS